MIVPTMGDIGLRKPLSKQQILEDWNRRIGVERDKLKDQLGILSRIVEGGEQEAKCLRDKATKLKEELKALKLEKEELTTQFAQRKKTIKKSKIDDNVRIAKDRKELKKEEKKTKGVSDAAKEWVKTHEKWVGRMQKTKIKEANADSALKELGICVVMDGADMCLALTNIDPLDPEAQGIIKVKGLDILNGTLQKVLSVSPSFPEEREFRRKANRHKDVVKTLILARKYWVTMYASQSSSMEGSKDLFDDT